ncbi:MAG: gluconolactonase [Betaproteobacteria bacterium]
MLEVDMSAPGIERLVSPDAPLDLIANDLTFGEGPLSSTSEGAFYFVDIVGDTIWHRRPQRGRDVFIRPSTKANGLTFDGQAGFWLPAGFRARSRASSSTARCRRQRPCGVVRDDRVGQAVPRSRNSPPAGTQESNMSGARWS